MNAIQNIMDSSGDDFLNASDEHKNEDQKHSEFKGHQKIVCERSVSAGMHDRGDCCRVRAYLRHVLPCNNGGQNCAPGLVD